MLKFGKGVVKSRIIIFIAAILLLIPSVLGYLHTRVNYDILSYLPENIETMKGQDILVDEFGTGAFSTFVVDGMSNKEISALKAKIEDVDHVKTVLWYDSVADISIPTDMLPEKMQKAKQVMALVSSFRFPINFLRKHVKKRESKSARKENMVLASSFSHSMRSNVPRQKKCLRSLWKKRDWSSLAGEKFR